MTWSNIYDDISMNNHSILILSSIINNIDDEDYYHSFGGIFIIIIDRVIDGYIYVYTINVYLISFP